MNCVLDTIQKIDTNRDDVYSENSLPFVQLPNAIIPAALASSRAHALSGSQVNVPKL